MTEQQGEHLAALTGQYAALRPGFLRWSATTLSTDVAVAVSYFQRAMVAWYEATARAQVPYEGDVQPFVRTMARYYADPKSVAAAAHADDAELDMSLTADRRPLEYIPQAVRMNARQLTMLTRFKELPKACRELLLMVRYHRIDKRRVAQVLGLTDGEEQVSERVRQCQGMVRQLWQSAGLTASTVHIPRAEEELVQNYLDGTLEATERWALEARLPNDTTLRETVTLQQDWAGVLLVAGRQDLMRVLGREEAQLVRQVPGAASEPGSFPLNPGPAPAPPLREDDVIFTRRKRWYDDLRAPNLQTLVAMTLIAVLTYLAWTTFGAAAPDQRAATNFVPYPNLFATTSPATSEDRDLQRILYYYDQGDYLTAYDELLPVADGYPAAPLYLGVSALALEQPSRTLDWLERIPPDSRFRAPADWYAALAYLAMNRVEAARLELQTIISTPGHPYRAQADQLLASL